MLLHLFRTLVYAHNRFQYSCDIATICLYALLSHPIRRQYTQGARFNRRNHNGGMRRHDKLNRRESQPQIAQDACLPSRMQVQVDFIYHDYSGSMASVFSKLRIKLRHSSSNISEHKPS